MRKHENGMESLDDKTIVDFKFFLLSPMQHFSISLL